jgi:topoisomerase-4 subunit A
VVFNPQTTEWQASYDGRKKEPVNLPVKFPLLLAQGVEGIAVGLATKVMPHNFIEICKGSIKVLEGKKATILPDFPNGGKADFSNYNDGLKGGKIRQRCDIESYDKKTLVIKNVPYGSTTNGLIESIIKANDSGKIKIKKVVDNTAKHVEVLVSLAPNVSPDVTIDALYAFTDCEVSISPNSCVIREDKPAFLGVSEILRLCTENTKDLLRQELEIRRAELMEKLLFSSLEKIFIQEEMYIQFKEYTDKPSLFTYLDDRFKPFKEQFYRAIEHDDFEKLTQIPMIRITRFDSSKADEKMRGLQEELDQVNHHLDHLVEYAIAYFEGLIDKFGKGKERKTEIVQFDEIKARAVVANNAKLYGNRKEGCVGLGLKKYECVSDCSDIDLVIVFRKNGSALVTKVADKTFVGKDVIHVQVWRKNDDRMVYNLIYLNGENGNTYAKRFSVTSITRDKEYELVKGGKKSKVLYFTDNPNGEAEAVSVFLSSGCSAKKKTFEFDFKDLAIKGRGAGGNTLTKYPIRKIDLKSKGVSTLAGIKIWYDETIGRLNTDSRGTFVGEFNGDDHILMINKEGSYELTSYELTNRYDPKKIEFLTRFTPEKVVSVVHYDGKTKNHYVKRFNVETTTLGKKFVFISEEAGSKMLCASVHGEARVELTEGRGANKEVSEISLISIIDVKGWKAIGNKLSAEKTVKVKLLSPLQDEIEEVPVPKEEEVAPLEEQPQAESPSLEEVEEEVKPKPKVKSAGNKDEASKDKPVSDKSETSPKDGIDIGTTIDLSPDDDGQTSLF